MEILFIILICGLVFLIFENFKGLILNEETMSGKNKRLNKLKFDGGELEEEEKIKKFIDVTTNPFLFLVPRNYKQTAKLKNKLEITGMDKYLSPSQYLVANVLLKVIGVVFFFLLAKRSLMERVIILAAFSLVPGFLLNNEYSERKKALLAEFPNVIKSLGCFLNADIAFTDCIRHTMSYSKDNWKPYLNKFISDCEIYNQREAIINICNTLDIFEIRDFFNMVLLSLEKGINLKESFELQADKMNGIYRQSVLQVINSRELLSTIIQAPMLLCIIAAFGAPMVGNFMDFTTQVF